MAKRLTSLALFLLGTGVASAADLPALPPMAPFTAPPPFSWTGFYVGGNLGGAWAQNNAVDTVFGLNFEGSNDGVFIGGGQVGLNYQFGYAVVGVEADIDWTANNRGNNTIVIGPLGNAFQLTSNNSWISTVAARLGFVAERSLLLYSKIGAGWVGDTGFTLTDLTTGQSFNGAQGNTNTGWLLGFGLEWAFTPNWTVKLEYDYLGMNNRTFTVNPNAIPVLAGDTFTTGSRNVQMGKVGINYLFNWGGPLAARY